MTDTLQLVSSESKNVAVYDFISRHPQLQAVKCEIWSDHPTHLANRLMNGLLDSCPNLRFLEVVAISQTILLRPRISVFAGPDLTEFDPAVVVKLRNSKLESLSHNIDMKIDATYTTDEIINDTLKSLTVLSGLGVRTVKWPSIQSERFVLLRMFRSLTHLSLTDSFEMDDCALQSIFQYQVRSPQFTWKYFCH